MVLVEGDVRQGRQAPVDHILMPVSTKLCALYGTIGGGAAVGFLD
jgi:hypothetical protein